MVHFVGSSLLDSAQRSVEVWLWLPLTLMIHWLFCSSAIIRSTFLVWVKCLKLLHELFTFLCYKVVKFSTTVFVYSTKRAEGNERIANVLALPTIPPKQWLPWSGPLSSSASGSIYFLISPSLWTFHPAHISPSSFLPCSPSTVPAPPKRFSPPFRCQYSTFKGIGALWNAYSARPNTGMCTLLSNCVGQMFNYTWQAKQREATPQRGSKTTD